jgi:hypothetical protein
MRIGTWILSALLLTPALGCASLTDFHYEQTQRSRARAAWRDHGGHCKNSAYSRDYEAGWKDGFYDVATGGKGCPPVVAPCAYWKPSQILEDRDQARNAYYNGFQDGVACALRYPQTHYLKLWTSCECPGLECQQPCSGASDCGCKHCSTPRFTFEGGEGLSEFTPGIVPLPSSIEDAPTGSSDAKSDTAGEEQAKAAAVTPAPATEPTEQPIEEIATPPAGATNVPSDGDASSLTTDSKFRVVEAQPLNLDRLKIKPTIIATSWNESDEEFGGMVEQSEPATSSTPLKP